MSVKSGNNEIVEFIPTSEKNDPKPFTVYFKPLSKGEYDSYVNSLGEYKRNKFVSHIDQSFRLLCTKTLATTGTMLKNVFYTPKSGKEEFLGVVTDREVAIEILCGLTNLEIANEIESAMKSQSSLDEDEVKN